MFWSVSKALETAVLCPTVIAIFLNSLGVFLVIFRSPSLIRRPSTLLLVSLTVSDLALLPYILFRLVLLYNYEVAGDLCEEIFTFLSIQTCIAFVHLCLLGCDRYAAIVHSLRYKAIITAKRVKRALVVAWAAPVVSWVVVPLCYDRSGGLAMFSGGCLGSSGGLSPFVKAHLILNLAVFGAIPFGVMVFVYCRIAKISWLQNNRNAPGKTLIKRKTAVIEHEKNGKKWLNTIVLTTAPILFSHFPAFICSSLETTLGPRFIPDWLCSAIVLSLVMNAALHPSTYGFRSRVLKKAFMKMLKPDQKNACSKHVAAVKKRRSVGGCLLKETCI